MTKLKSTLVDVKDGKYTYFKINKEDTKKFSELMFTISRKTYEEKLVPKELFTEFMQCLIPIEIELELKNKEKLNIAIIHFSKDKKYNFEYFDSTRQTNYCLIEMLSQCFSKALDHQQNDISQKKEFCLKKCYQSLKEYKVLLPMDYQGKYFTHYKMTVIAAYIATILGYFINDDIEESLKEGIIPSNYILFHATNASTEKYK